MAGKSKIKNFAIGIGNFLGLVTSIKDDIMLAINFTPASNTATTAEEKLMSLPVVAGSVSVSDLLDIMSYFAFTGSVNLKTMRMYINSIDSLSGAILIATATEAIATNIGRPVHRFLPVLSDTLVSDIGQSAPFSNYSTTTQTPSDVVVPSLSSDFFIIFSGQKSSAGETLTIRYSFVRNNKL